MITREPAREEHGQIDEHERTFAPMQELEIGCTKKALYKTNYTKRTIQNEEGDERNSIGSEERREKSWQRMSVSGILFSLGILFPLESSTRA